MKLLNTLRVVKYNNFLECKEVFQAHKLKYSFFLVHFFLNKTDSIFSLSLCTHHCYNQKSFPFASIKYALKRKRGGGRQTMKKGNVVISLWNKAEDLRTNL